MFVGKRVCPKRDVLSQVLSKPFNKKMRIQYYKNTFAVIQTVLRVKSVCEKPRF